MHPHELAICRTCQDLLVGFVSWNSCSYVLFGLTLPKWCARLITFGSAETPPTSYFARLLIAKWLRSGGRLSTFEGFSTTILLSVALGAGVTPRITSAARQTMPSHRNTAFLTFTGPGMFSSVFPVIIVDSYNVYHA